MSPPRRKKDAEPDRQGDLYSVREPERVSVGISDGSSKEQLQVRSVPGSPSGGKPGDASGKHGRGQASSDGRSAKRKLTRNQKLTRIPKTCDICGVQFRVNKEEMWKGRCGECSPVMRETLMTCPGCNRKFRYARMVPVSVYVQPSQKGGKKFNIRYCEMCVMQVRARSDKLVKMQQEEWDRKKGAQREFMSDVRGQ